MHKIEQSLTKLLQIIRDEVDVRTMEYVVIAAGILFALIMALQAGLS